MRRILLAIMLFVGILNSFGIGGEVEYQLNLSEFDEHPLEGQSMDSPSIEFIERSWTTPGIEQQSPRADGMHMSQQGVAAMHTSFACLPDWLDGAVWPLTKQRIEASMLAAGYRYKCKGVVYSGITFNR